MLQNTYGLLAHGANLFSNAATLISLNICLLGGAQNHFFFFRTRTHMAPLDTLTKKKFRYYKRSYLEILYL